MGRARIAGALVALVIAASAMTATTATAAPVRGGKAEQAACFFPKTKFLFHAGLAFGAFHRYIYKPFKAGTFTGPNKVTAIAKAALAGLFVYHEVGEALKQAQCSHTLAVLVSPLTALSSAIKAAADKLKAGGLPDITSLGKSFDQIGSTAGGIGVPIKDIVHNL